MNIIQARIVNSFGDGYGKKYIFKVPDGVSIKKDTLLAAEKNGGKDGIQIVKAVSDSIEVTDEVLDMIMDGKEVISSIIGVYELKKLKLEEQKEPEEVDWSKVEVDTPILVKNYEDAEWKKRYFAEYRDGRVYAWANGQTSWTTGGCKLVWNCAKLAEVEE